MAYYNSSKAQQLPIQSMPLSMPQIQDQPPIVYYTAPAITYKNFVPHYDRKTSTGLGATQIILACLSIAAGVMAIVCHAGGFYIGVGIWAGLWYLIAGSLALAAGIRPTNSRITATLVFSVFNMLFGIAQVSITSLGIVFELECFEGYPPNYQYSTCVEWWTAAVAANSMMIGVGCLEVIFGLWMTVISGHAIRQGSKPPIANITVTFAPNQPEPVFMHGILPHPPAVQSEPPPYYAQPPYSSTSNQQQTFYIGVDQEVPATNIKS